MLVLRPGESGQTAEDQRGDSSPSGEHVTVRIRPLDGPGQTPSVCLVEFGPLGEETEAKVVRWQRAVATAKEQWEATFDAISEMVLIIDSSFKILRTNKATCLYLGRDFQAILDRDCRALLNLDGERAGLRHMDSLVRTGEPLTCEYNDPRTGKDLHLSAWPITRRPDGALTGTFVLMVSDVTARNKIQKKMAESEKLSAMGQLVSSVAHELNNPLTTIIGYSELVESESSADDRAQGLRTVQLEALRCQKIVQNLLSYVRQQEPVRRSLDLNDVVRDVMDLRGYHLEVSGVTVDVQLAEDLPAVTGDRQQLLQVLLNLVNNADQAMTQSSGGKRITIRTDRAGLKVLVEVSDNGPGLSDEVLPHIFEPFFTTKPRGLGTGLGLAVSHGIVAVHGGTITVTNLDGGGARFRVTVPKGEQQAHSGEPVARTAQASPAEARTLNGKSVLVVDDEPALLALLARLLSREGCRVLAASTAAAGLELVRNRGPFDAIVTDLKMPGLGGKGFYQALEREFPTQAARVIFATGEVTCEDRVSFLPRTGRNVISKPFRSGDLIEAVAAVIAET